MGFANNVPDVPKKKQRRTFLIVKNNNGSYCTLRNDSVEFVYRSHKDVDKRLKHAVPFFVALKDENDRPNIAEVVGKASNSNTAADVLDSFNEQLKNTPTDSGLSEGIINWEFCVSGILYSLLAIACFVAVRHLLDIGSFPDEFLGVWKMSNTSDLKSYFDNNSAKRYIPCDIPKFLKSKALPVIIFEKGSGSGQITMKRLWVDNVMEKSNIPLNTEFTYHSMKNFMFLEKFAYKNGTLVHESQFINGIDKIEGIKFTEVFTKKGINQIIEKHVYSNMPYEVTWVKVEMKD